MKTLSQNLKNLLYENGASKVGFADLSEIVESELHYGVSVAVRIPTATITSIANGPTMEYYDAYHHINEKLNALVTKAATFLKENGYEAYAQTTDVVKEFDVYRTALPHKTVATNAGIGWIGKSALLVTEEFGSALRLSSLITNAKLDCDAPIKTSKCGNCMICKNACPAGAITGKLWSVEIDRDEFYHPLLCRKKARELAANHLNKEITLCGKCIEVCPYTRKYIATGN